MKPAAATMSQKVLDRIISGDYSGTGLSKLTDEDLTTALVEVFKFEEEDLQGYPDGSLLATLKHHMTKASEAAFARLLDGDATVHPPNLSNKHIRKVLIRNEHYSADELKGLSREDLVDMLEAVLDDADDEDVPEGDEEEEEEEVFEEEEEVFEAKKPRRKSTSKRRRDVSDVDKINLDDPSLQSLIAQIRGKKARNGGFDR